MPAGRSNMTGRRVVVTGIGVVSSIGSGVGAFADALKCGKSAISPIRSFDSTGFPSFMAGDVHTKFLEQEGAHLMKEPAT